VEADDRFRMRPDALRLAMEDDLARGIRPVAVVATLGTTSTTSVDPVDEIADVAEKLGIWLHVDAAYAGSAAVLPELREHFQGWGRADSVVMNPHKWLFTPVDCSVLYCRRPEVLRRAFSLTPEYLRTAETGRATNLMDYGVALGRRFRSLKLWFVLRYFGAEGIRARIRGHIGLARAFADRVDSEPGWSRVAPVPFSTVVFRFAPEGVEGEDQDRMNLEILEEVNRTGEAFLSHTRLRDRICLRLSVGNLRTREEHLDRAWTLLREAAERREARAPAT
jgi:aromatic-L-amino-acid decarboxylase